MKVSIVILLTLLSCGLFSQSIEPCDIYTIQTQVKVDTFVIPDAIFLEITTLEKETSDELDKLESKILSKLKSLNINTDANFKYTDFGSRIQSKFFGKDIKQSRKYELRLNDADTAVKVISELNQLNVGRIQLSRFKYTQEETLKRKLSEKAIVKARNQAIALTQPIGQSIGRAIHIVDRGNDEINQLANSFTGMNQDYRSREESKIKAPQFKKIKFVKSLYVVFELK